MLTDVVSVSHALALETGFRLDHLKEHFDRLSLIFKKAFVEKKDAYYFNYDEGSKLSLKI